MTDGTRPHGWPSTRAGKPFTRAQMYRAIGTTLTRAQLEQRVKEMINGLVSPLKQCTDHELYQLYLQGLRNRQNRR